MTKMMAIRVVSLAAAKYDPHSFLAGLQENEDNQKYANNYMQSEN